MSLIGIIVFLVIAAFAVWLVGKAPMLDATVKQWIVWIMYAVIGVTVILWIASFFFGYRPPWIRGFGGL